MLQNTQVVIFDLGGVIINLDIHKTLDAFRTLIGEDFDLLEEAQLNQSFYMEYEKGNISCEEFRSHIRGLTSKQLTDQQIDDAWNSMLLDIPPDRFRWIDQLKGQYQLCILSNTNVIHVETFHKIFGEQTPYQHPGELFDKLFYSCEMGMRKPDEDIYLEVLKGMGAAPHEAVFYDDKQENIDTAERLGIRGVLVERNYLTQNMLPGNNGRA